MKKIILKPYGGLANRFMAINAAINIKKILNFDLLQIVWERNDELFSKYSSLFKKNSMYDIIETSNFKWFDLSTYNQVYNTFEPSHYKYSLLNEYLGKERCFDQIIYNHPKEKFHFELSSINSSAKTIYIAAHDEFYTCQKEKFDYPSLNKEIENVVKNNCGSFDDKTIGIHIRRTDRNYSKKHSPDELFVSKIKELIDKGFNIYLATDDEKLENILLKLFNKNLIVQKPKYFTRKNFNGIKSAVIDLYSLANTKFIFGTYSSSFGLVASKIGKVQYKILSIEN